MGRHFPHKGTWKSIKVKRIGTSLQTTVDGIEWNCKTFDEIKQLLRSDYGGED